MLFINYFLCVIDLNNTILLKILIEEKGLKTSVFASG